MHSAVTAAARDKGLLIVPAGHNTIRLLPALTASPEELERIRRDPQPSLR